MAEIKPKNLYQKLLDITEAAGKIEKTGSNTAQNYKFIEQGVVVAEIRVQLAKHGVMIIPETVERRMERYVKTMPGYKQGDPPKEQSTFHANVKSRYTLVNADDPADRMVCEWDAGEALDTSDKATNKATTASHKSFLMKLFNISDKDDPDAHSPEASGSKKPIVYNRDDFQPEPSVDISESEGITQDVVTKLEGALKLKGITKKTEVAIVLTELAKTKGGETIYDISLAQGREIYAQIRAAESEQLAMLMENVK